MNEPNKLMEPALKAAATIGAIYEWLDRVDEAGGATSISGIAACNSMLKSLRDNRKRIETLITKPLRDAIAEQESGQ